MPTMTAPRWQAAIALSVFFLALVSARLFSYLGGVPATLLWKLSWIGLSMVGLVLAHRVTPVGSLVELGLGGSVGTGAGFAFVASLPMLLTFAFTTKPNPSLALGATLMTSIVSPMSEEVLFRGYLFRQLYRRAGWNFFWAVALTAGVFGLAHFGNLFGKTGATGMASEIAVIAAGGAFYAWLFIRWNDNLWVPIALHSFMNLWCILFACDQAVGSWRNNGARGVTVVLAIVLTRLRNRRMLARAREGPPIAPGS